MYSVDFLVVFSVDDNIVLSSGINHYWGFAAGAPCELDTQHLKISANACHRATEHLKILDLND